MNNNEHSLGSGIKILGLLIVGSMIFSVIFFPMSIDKVDTSEVAFRKHRFKNEVDFDNVYGTGRHWNGFAYKFIIFDVSAQNVEFTGSDQISARTSDGLAISFDISFQYQLQSENVAELYVRYIDTYEDAFIREARDSIRDTCSLYTAIEFFNDRTSIGDVMESNLDETLNEIWCNVLSLQMRNVDLPDAFEQALEQAEIARQDYEVALREQEAAVVRAETEILLAQSQANITLLEAQTAAEALLIETSAIAEALNLTISAEADALYYLQQTLGLNSTEMLTYLWIDAIENGNIDMLIIGDNAPEILLTEP